MLVRGPMESQGFSRAAFLLEALGENLFPSFSQLLEAACLSSLMAPFPIIKARKEWIEG